MRRLQGHFLVATLAPLGDGEAAEPELAADSPSYEVSSTRQALLHHCMRLGLQFNSLRYAQYSTMMLIYEMLHPTAANATESPCRYCLPDCKRGRADDGSIMIACDICDNWFHPGCLSDRFSNPGDDSFVCPLCVDAKADVYVNGELASCSLLGDFTGDLSDLLG
jgi:hypothetical protein